jgi:NAD-dependent SIR2 family protein deacetylase
MSRSLPMSASDASPHHAALDAAASAIAHADAILIGAGAGMGVDSGLPDFRGPEGFWRAYPALKGKVRFEEMANPVWFDEKPQLAWAFYGHRLHLYRDTVPHAGFHLLRELVGERPYFVFTSNVDGHFHKSGFPEDHIYEVHGSIHHIQRTDGRGPIWPADGVNVSIDAERFLARDPLPLTPDGHPARPNILMFGDYAWNDARAMEQEARYHAFLQAVRGKNLVAIEMGAGTAIPTVRHQCRYRSQTLIRINPRESQGPAGTISLAMGAKAALEEIRQRLT